MWTKAFITIIGVYMVYTTNQSELGDQNLPIMTDRGRQETPEVVLQLKYEEGELNKIYLTQFRKEPKTLTPSVPAQNSLCADLCYGGLGGEVCGSTCEKMVPVGLQTALNNKNSTEDEYGQPRVGVCPVLCRNGLGSPLCHCSNHSVTPTDWKAVCNVFCDVDKYELRGCPKCEKTDSQRRLLNTSMMTLDTAQGWRFWCNVQCRQGHGGAACNCDRGPFQ
ncbi:unnamed protein product [Danaus chrysippus]|uniref:(African queen) hypothetical protein n=1 Tax=Danaus chrysippus TaxID=151541 RepID=A0A8J2W5W8_9NEOP|nr:unnamed protein product [Danaus chrysippus]